jgi:hypothetical protein
MTDLEKYQQTIANSVGYDPYNSVATRTKFGDEKGIPWQTYLKVEEAIQTVEEARARHIGMMPELVAPFVFAEATMPIGPDLNSIIYWLQELFASEHDNSRDGVGRWMKAYEELKKISVQLKLPTVHELVPSSIKYDPNRVVPHVWV